MKNKFNIPINFEGNDHFELDNCIDHFDNKIYMNCFKDKTFDKFYCRWFNSNKFGIFVKKIIEL